MLRVVGFIVAALFVLWVGLALVGLIVRLLFWAVIIGVLALAVMAVWNQLQPGSRRR